MSTVQKININGDIYTIEDTEFRSTVSGLTINNKNLIDSPSLTPSDIGAMPGNFTLADINTDETHRLVTDEQISSWSAKSNFSGNYNDLVNTPTLGSAAATNSTDYDVAGAASDALASAKTYADSLAMNYDTVGSATTALNSAKAYADSLAKDHVSKDEKGAYNGIATLDENGKVPSSQLPSYVDDVEEYSGRSSFPTTGESGKIYIDTASNITYRWTGSDYCAIGSDLALGETASTAYAGDKGKANAEAISALQQAVNDMIWTGTQEQYNAIAVKSDNTIYLIRG